MAITNYTELQTAIANWSERSDLSARIPEFIALAEARINRKLRLRMMETSTTLTTIADVSTVSLPSDFIEARTLYIDGSTKRDLEQKSFEQLTQLRAGSQSGKPYIYTISGDSVHLAPTPDSAYSVIIHYYKRIDPLSSVSTNSLLQDHPGVYLFGALFELYHYLMDDQMAKQMMERFEYDLDDVKVYDQASRNSGGKMVARTATGNP